MPCVTLYEHVREKTMKPQRDKDTENLCVSVSPWLIYLRGLLPAL